MLGAYPEERKDDPTQHSVAARLGRAYPMPIVAEAGPSVQEYIELELERHSLRPEICTHCGVEGQMIGHGYYVRKPKGLDKGWVLQVKRWKCKACQHTVGAVPSFLLFFRHYLLSVIQGVVVGRFELGYTWSQMVGSCSDNGAPALRAMQRWCVGYAEHAGEWLAILEKALAEQDSRSSWLDACETRFAGEAQKVRGKPQALLQASLHLLAWAQGRWRELEGYVLNDRLRWLWYWGNRQGGLSRLA